MLRRRSGISLNVETVDGLTVQARITRRPPSSTGPDIICALNNWAQLYAESVADVSDVGRGDRQCPRRLYETSTPSPMTARSGSPCRHDLGLLFVNRTSWWNEIGYGPEKYTGNLGRVARSRQEVEGEGPPAGADARPCLRRRQRILVPLSVVVGRQRGGGPTARPWCSGSKETIKSVKFAIAFVEGRLRGRGHSLGIIPATTALSLPERSAPPTTAPPSTSKPKRSPTPIAPKMASRSRTIAFTPPLPKGPAGQASWHVPLSDMVLSYSKNQKAAKDFLRWFHTRRSTDSGS